MSADQHSHPSEMLHFTNHDGLILGAHGWGAEDDERNGSEGKKKHSPASRPAKRQSTVILTLCESCASSPAFRNRFSVDVAVAIAIAVAAAAAIAAGACGTAIEQIR